MITKEQVDRLFQDYLNAQAGIGGEFDDKEISVKHRAYLKAYNHYINSRLKGVGR